MPKKTLPRTKRPSPTSGGRRGAGKIDPAQPEQPVEQVSGSGDAKQAFPVVGVGASAGGFEAFAELLRELPAKPGMAIVFVQHLDPKHVSVLAQLLQRESSMPVLEAKDGAPVQADHVYIIPRNTSISFENGILKLGPREVIGGQLTSIDIFLRSLAADQGSKAIGVLLSGNASDGTLGLKAIKASGGITFAQEPGTAKFDGMPRNAIGAGWVDLVRTPGDIAHELVRLKQNPYVGSGKDSAKEAIPESSDAVNRILALVRSRTGVDFSLYKTNTVRRRILRRMVLRRADNIEDYLGLVRGDKAEVQALYEDILISVTEFFRDPDTFAALIGNIFPKIIGQSRQNRELRLWVPGCSTGEEVYSLTIAMLEALGDRADEIPLQVFATDVSEPALEKARSGWYPLSIGQNVSPERLRRFFVKADSGYQITKRVRELCIFARQNLTKDPPFSKLDFISCRNVLIYLGPGLQERVIPMFHYALKPHGFLLLGSSETVGTYTEMFQLVDKKNRIYQRRSVPTRISLDFALDQVSVERQEAPRRPEPVSEFDLQRESDRIVLNRYAPPGVVIDDDMNIVQIRGQTSRYLAPASGAASLNLLRMLKEGLTAEVRAAVSQARKTNSPARREQVYCSGDGANFVNIQVIPLRRLPGRDRKYLLLFEAVPKEPEAEKKKGKLPAAEHRLESEVDRLRLELKSSNEYLQTTMEDNEAAQEELRSAAEEIQSSNEELQSTNEELETAKEELQSTNEELNTVNEELQNRNMQLAQVGNDLLNLLANVNMPILILGNDLRIRRFTPVAERSLNLIASDVGRPIRDLNLRIPIPDLEKVLSEVADNLVPQAVEVQDPEGRTYSLRIRPYRTEDNKIDGVVLVFVDVDPVMQAAEVSGSNWAMLQNKAGMSVLLATQEAERRRLAHELHDELNQKLALLEFNVQQLQMRDDKESVFVHLEDFRESVASLSDDLRRIAYQIHPAIVEELGLVPALRFYCDEFAERERIQLRFSTYGTFWDLPPQVSITLYRLLQEALRNVAKHSGARRAQVRLTFGKNNVELMISDSGNGFYPAGVLSTGLGMTGMRERVALLGGTIEWKSKPGEGTQVMICIPVPADEGEAKSASEEGESNGS